VGVVDRDVLLDGRDQVGNALENPPPETLGGDLAEPSFDEVQPRRARGGEVGVKPGVLGQPLLDLRVRVGPVVVHDQVQIQPGRRRPVELPEERPELPIPMPGRAGPNDGPVQHVQSGKEGRGAVPLAVVGHRAVAALLDRKARLGAVQGLDLALLVETHDQPLIRRVEVQVDHAGEPLGEAFVPGDLEGPHPMRLEAMGLPDAGDRRVADAERVRHRSRAPVRGPFGSGLGGRPHDGLHRSGRDRGAAARPGASFCSAARPPTVNRFRHRSAVGRVVPRRWAICLGGTPCAARSTIRARRCNRRGVVRARTPPSTVLRSASLIVTAVARFAMASSLLFSGTIPWRNQTVNLFM